MAALLIAQLHSYLVAWPEEAATEVFKRYPGSLLYNGRKKSSVLGCGRGGPGHGGVSWELDATWSMCRASSESGQWNSPGTLVLVPFWEQSLQSFHSHFISLGP